MTPVNPKATYAMTGANTKAAGIAAEVRRGRAGSSDGRLGGAPAFAAPSARHRPDQRADHDRADADRDAPNHEVDGATGRRVVAGCGRRLLVELRVLGSRLIRCLVDP